MSARVWWVEHGEYDNFQQGPYFSSREEADKFIEFMAAMGRGDDYEIGEDELHGSFLDWLAEARPFWEALMHEAPPFVPRDPDLHFYWCFTGVYSAYNGGRVIERIKPGWIDEWIRDHAASGGEV